MNYQWDSRNGVVDEHGNQELQLIGGTKFRAKCGKLLVEKLNSGNGFNAELVAALKEIAALEIQSTRGTSAEFAVKRLSEVCSIARQAIAKA